MPACVSTPNWSMAHMTSLEIHLTLLYLVHHRESLEFKTTTTDWGQVSLRRPQNFCEWRPRRIRSPDSQIRSLMLYPVELRSPKSHWGDDMPTLGKFHQGFDTVVGAINVNPGDGRHRETAPPRRRSTAALPKAIQWVPKCSKPQPPSHVLIIPAT